MKFEIEAEVITKVVSMIMENNNRNAEVAMKVLDKCCDIADKFVNIAAASIKASDERSRIRFEQEQEERKLRLERAAEEAEERKKDWAERQAERDLATARRNAEWEELNSSKNKKNG
jgi:hypothetical protein